MRPPSMRTTISYSAARKILLRVAALAAGCDHASSRSAPSCSKCRRSFSPKGAGFLASSRSRMARRIAGTLMKCKAEETFSGVYLNAVKGNEWLFTGAYADLVSVGDFDPRALLIGRTTVFLNI